MNISISADPRYGVIGRAANQFRLGMGIIGDDILGFLYRYDELAPADAAPVPIAKIKDALKAGSTMQWMAWKLARQQLIETSKAGLTLTDKGKSAGRGLIRSHRLWETYLCDVMGCCEADVHRHAHHFEHVTDPRLQQELMDVTSNPDQDPHHREIP